MTWYFWLRSVNIAGALIALWILSTAAYRYWRTWLTPTKFRWAALAGWVTLGVESTIEQMIMHNAPGPRIFVATAVIACTLISLWIPQGPRQEQFLPWTKEKAHEFNE